jgi:uncharacterized protein (TIGR03086 family)
MHGEGWDHYLARLERLATTGDAGPDEWAATPDPLTAVSAAEAVLGSSAASAAQSDHGGPHQADAMRRLRLPRRRGTPDESLVGLGAMADVTVEDAEGTSLENRISVMTAQAIDGWRTVDSEGTVTGPRGNEMPASYAQGLLPFELLMHGWDMAQAAGLPLQVSDEVVAYLRKITEPLMPSARERGAFGPEVSPADDASPLDRLAAYAGRTPLGRLTGPVRLMPPDASARVGVGPAHRSRKGAQHAAARPARLAPRSLGASSRITATPPDSVSTRREPVP